MPDKEKKKRNRILLITNLCAPYRVGLFELLSKKYNIKFLFFSAGEEKYYDGPSVMGNFDGEYLKGFYILPKIKINPKLIRILLFDNYTHVIKCVNGPLPILLSFVIGKLRGKKVILWSSFWRHPTTFFHKFSFPVIKYLYNHADAVVVYGTHVKKYLESIGVQKEKISIAWQVQDNTKFQKHVEEDEKNELRKQLGLKSNKIIIFVGRLVEVKGIPFLLEAFKMLQKKEVALLIIGSGPDEKLIPENRANIVHLPRIASDNLYQYYALADIFVLPSITTDSFKENWGFVVNEAMCQGCAIITSDAVGAGVGGLIEEGQNGYIVPERNSKALTEAFSKILDDDTLLENMKKRSLEMIQEWKYEKMASGFDIAIDYTNSKN